MRSNLIALRSLGFNPSNILDVGAYNGAWAKMVKEIFPLANIHCVEAQPKLEPFMAALFLEYFPAVTYTMTLLGARSAERVPFYVMDTLTGSTGSSMFPETTNYARYLVELPMRTVDQIIQEHGDEPVDLLKLDVQGAEIEVLKGAKNVLQKTRVVIAEMSLVEYNQDSPLLHEVLSFLADQGFVLFDVIDQSRLNRGVLIQIDGLFVRKEDPFRSRSVWSSPI